MTGDITHSGRQVEVDRFFAIFEPFLRDDRLIVVPGNHDRLGDDVADRLMNGPRVRWPGPNRCTRFASIPPVRTTGPGWRARAS